MERAKAESYLQNIRDARIRIDTLEEMRSEVKSNIGLIRGESSETVTKTSPARDAQEKRIIKSIEKLERLDKKLASERTKYLHFLDQAFDRIMHLKEGQCRRFLLDYYIYGKNMIEIAYDYRYETTESIYKLKKRAIDYYAKLF